MTEPHTLYTFRRCPYAMRARMALAVSGVPIKIREVVLRDKPAEMLAVSPKGTVPVLVLNDGTVIDESMGIIFWALHQSTDNDFGIHMKSRVRDRLLEINDGAFKAALDRYKYPNRYEQEGIDREKQRALGSEFLAELDVRLEKSKQLMGEHTSFADFAIFPFVRQFANTDRDWFDAQPWPHLHRWLAEHLESELFLAVMKKYPQWRPGDFEPELPLATHLMDEGISP